MARWKVRLDDSVGQPISARISSWLDGQKSGRRSMIFAARRWSRSKRVARVDVKLLHAMEAYSSMGRM